MPMEELAVPFYVVFVLTMFDTLGLAIISKSIGAKMQPSKYKVFIVFLTYQFLETILLFKGVKLTFAITILMLYFVLEIVYEKGVRNTLALEAVTLVAYITIQFSMALIKLQIFGHDQSLSINLTMQFLNLSIYFVSTKIINFRKMYQFILTKDNIFNTIFIISYVIIIFSSVAFQFNYNAVGNVIIFAVTIMVVVVINIIIYIYTLKARERNERNRIYSEYIPVITEMITEIRARQHEFDNHIQTISILPLLYNNYDSLSAKLKSYTSSMVSDDTLSSFLKLDREVISALLYTKKKKAEQKGISFNVEIENPSIESAFKDYELVEMIGTLIDNAYEAATEDKKDVIVKILKEDGRCAIEVLNQHDYVPNEVLNGFFAKGYSTKDKKSSAISSRGLGLYNLSQIIKKCNGIIIMENKALGDFNYVSIKLIL